jgi:hypothetical protein
MNEIEIVEERQRAQSLHGQIHEDAGPFVPHGSDDIAPLDELEREAWEAGVRRRAELVHFDEVGVMKAGERRELAAESLLMLCPAARRELFEGEILAGPIAILDEPHSAGSSFAEDPFHDVAITGTVLQSHGPIVNDLDAVRERNTRMCLENETY